MIFDMPHRVLFDHPDLGPQDWLTDNRDRAEKIGRIVRDRYDTRVKIRSIKGERRDKSLLVR